MLLMNEGTFCEILWRGNISASESNALKTILNQDSEIMSCNADFKRIIKKSSMNDMY